MTREGIEVYRGGHYQIICSIYDAAPQIRLYMYRIYRPGLYMLNTDTCKANRSSITYYLSSTLETSFTCSTLTDGPSLSNTTVSITVGEYHA